jgi:hypothetical protein
LFEALKASEREQGETVTFAPEALELFLQERCPQLMSFAAMRGVPPGATSLMCTLLADYTTETGYDGLLQHGSIHTALTSILLSFAAIRSDADVPALVRLARAVVVHLRRNPAPTGFFFRLDPHAFSCKSPVFVPGHMLIENMHTSERAVDGVLECIALAVAADHPELLQYLRAESGLIDRVVQGCRDLELPAVRPYYRSISALAVCEDEELAVAAVDAFIDGVLVEKLGPALLTPHQLDEKRATAAAHKLATLVDCASGAVVDGSGQSILTHTLVNFVGMDGDGDDGEEVRAALIRGASASVDRPMAAAAFLRSIDALLALCQPCIVDSLVGDALRPRAHLVASAPASPSLSSNTAQEGITTFLSFFPGTKYGSDTSYADYLVDARSRIAGTARRYGVDAGGEADAEAEARAAATTGSVDGERPTWTEPPLLTALFDATQVFFTLPLPCQLMITSVWTRLAQVPDPQLHQLLLDPHAPLRPGVRSLAGTLRTLRGTVDRSFMEKPVLVGGLAEARESLGAGGATETGSPDAIADRRLLRGVAVLVEFCKELAACIQVKHCELNGN